MPGLKGVSNKKSRYVSWSGNGLRQGSWNPWGEGRKSGSFGDLMLRHDCHRSLLNPTTKVVYVFSVTFNSYKTAQTTSK